MEYAKTSDSSPVKSKIKNIHEFGSQEYNKIDVRNKNPICTWDCAKVQEWLTNEGLDSLKPLFKEKNITGKFLLKSNYDNLKDIGVNCVSDRTQLLSSIKFASRMCITTSSDKSSSKYSKYDFSESSTSHPLSASSKSSDLQKHQSISSTSKHQSEKNNDDKNKTIQRISKKHSPKPSKLSSDPSASQSNVSPLASYIPTISDIKSPDYSSSYPKVPSRSDSLSRNLKYFNVNSPTSSSPSLSRDPTLSSSPKSVISSPTLKYSHNNPISSQSSSLITSKIQPSPKLKPSSSSPQQASADNFSSSSVYTSVIVSANPVPPPKKVLPHSRSDLNSDNNSLFSGGGSLSIYSNLRNSHSLKNLPSVDDLKFPPSSSLANIPDSPSPRENKINVRISESPENLYNSNEYPSLKISTTGSESSLPISDYVNKKDSDDNESFINERPADEHIVNELERYFPGIDDDIFTPLEGDEQDIIRNYDRLASLSDDENLYTNRQERKSQFLNINASENNVQNDDQNGELSRKFDPDPIRLSPNSNPDSNHVKLPPLDVPEDFPNYNIYAVQKEKDWKLPSAGKMNIDMYNENLPTKRNVMKKSIQTRAQSALLTKRISKIINRRSNYNANRLSRPIFINPVPDYQASNAKIRPPTSPIEVPKLDNYVIRGRTSSMKMSKYYSKMQLDSKNKIPSALDAVIQKRNLQRGIQADPNDNNALLQAPQLASLPSIKNQILKQPGLPMVHKTPPTNLKDTKRYSNDDFYVDKILSAKRRENEYGNEVPLYEKNKERNSVKSINPQKQQQGNTTYGKVLDFYGVMKSYETTDNINNLILSKYSQQPNNTSIGFKWRLGKVIGKGAFGTVYIGINMKTGNLMAVKQVDLMDNKSGTLSRKMRQLESIKREIEFLKEVQHENIVAYFGCASKEHTFNIFLEYVSGGSIASCLKRYGAFEDDCVRCFTAQILFGLEYLHSVNIIHRDIKGANVLVDAEGVAKISDFGISKKNKYNQAYHRVTRMSMQGTVPWMAPEVTRGKGYSAKVDIWSLGCLVLEMLTNRNPWYKVEGNVIYLLGNGKAPPIPSDISEDANKFLAKCFHDNPEIRPTATELLNEENGYCNSKNPLEFNFRVWKNKITHKRAESAKKMQAINSNSIQSNTNSSVTFN